MKKILVSLGLVLTLVLCCAFVPVNAAEECTHEKVTFQYFLDEQEKPVTCAESGIAKYTCDDCKASVYKKEVGKHVLAFDFTELSCTEAQKVIEKCTVCKEVVSETEVAAALRHDLKEVAVKASCGRGAGIAKKCTRCGEETEFVAYEESNELYAPATGHKWEDTTVVKATCKEGGYTIQTCANCKETQKVNVTEKDPVNGHKAVLVSTLKEPVCTVNGIGKFKCELCDAEIGYASIPAAHKWDYANMEIIEEATCGKPGKANLECSLCDATLKDFVIDNATIKHEWKDAVLGEDCENPARVGQICEVCGEEDVEVVAGSKAKGHQYAEEYKEPTCDKASGIEKVCSECGDKVFVEFEEGHALYKAAKGHTETTVKGKAATCSAEGLTDGVKCKVCNIVLVKQEKIAKNPSVHTAKLIDTLKAKTCTANGVGKFACKDCDKDLGYKAIEAGHEYEVVVTTAPTCGKAGKGNKVCKVCGDTVKDVVVDATGKHNYVTTTIDATCTAPAKVGKECTVCKAQKDVTNVSGSKALGHAFVDAYVAESCEDPSGILTTCERCDYENFAAFTADQEGLYKAPKGHKETTVKGKAATCSAEGLTDGKKCSVCNEVLVKQEKIAKNPDAHTEKLIDTLKAKTCKANGVGKYACKDCNKDLGYKAIAASHEYEMKVTTAATCAKAGKGNKVCKVCGDTVKNVEIPATGKHNYVQTTIDATCTDPAKVGKECTVCKAQKDVTNVSGSKALGHALVDAYVAESCEDPSGILTTCERCDYEKFVAFTADQEGLYKAPKGHKEATVKGKAATCSAEGLTDGKECSVCKAVLVKQEKIAKNPDAHTEKLIDTLKAKTCTTNGVGKYACKDCKKDLGYKAIAASHEYEMVVTTAATCAKAGKGNKVCKVCGYTVKDVVIPATGKHNYVQTTIDATCTEPAKVGKECTVCKAQKDVVTVQGSKALGHAYVEEFAEASCDKASGIAISCERCKYTDYKPFTAENGDLYAPAKGHTEVVIKAVAATCSAKGATAGVKCKVCNTVIEEPQEVAKNPDNHTAKLVDTLKAATCSTSGVGKYACKDCKADLGYKAIPAQHTLILVVEKAPTCGKEGKGYNMCLVEGCKYVEKDVVIEATGEHNYVKDSVIDATCTEPAKAGTICSVCGDAKDDVVAVGQPNGHVWKETPADATCTTPAGVSKVCTVCEAKDFEAYTGELAEAAKGHQYENITVEGTCKVAGFTADVCKVCKDTQNKVEGSKNPDNHNAKAGTIIKAATCQSSGVAKAECADCGTDLGYIAVPADHAFGAEYANESGTLVYVKCDDCDTIKVVAYFGTKDVEAGDVFASLEAFEKAEAAK